MKEVSHKVFGWKAFAPEKTEVIYCSETGGRFGMGRKALVAKDDIEITWVRSAKAIGYLIFKGKIIKIISERWDVAGAFSAGSLLFSEASGVAKSFGIEPSDALQYQVVGFIHDAPAIGPAHKDVFGKDWYNSLEGAYYNTTRAKIGEPFSEKSFRLDDRQLIKPIEHSATVIWSSKLTQVDNLALFDGFKSNAQQDARTVVYTDVPISPFR